MTQTLMLNILVLGLLVALFASIDRLRSSARVRLWMFGWMCVLVHFGILLWQPTQPRLAVVSDALATSALMLCGILFLVSASVPAAARLRVQVALSLAIPALTFVWLVSLGVRSPMAYLVLELIGHGAGLMLLWFFYRDRPRFAVLGTAVIIGCLFLILYEIIMGRPESGVDLILMELFTMHALLFWQDHRRQSAGVATTVWGLLCWAAVFPIGLALDRFSPGMVINGEVWNVPKFVVAFGMIVTLLEEEIGLASRQFAQYQMLFQRNPLPMWIVAADSEQMLEANAAAVSSYGYERAELLRMSMGALVPELAPAGDRKEELSRGGSHTPWRLHKRDGGTSMVELKADPVLFEGREAYLVLAHDVTERHRLHEQLIHQANHDPLTGLPNRLLLEDRIKAALAAGARHGTRAAILCIDLDRFKQINDTFGHAAGDDCLKEFAARLRRRLRDVDTAARVGGEEFMVVLDRIKSVADAERVADDLLAELRAPYLLEGRIVRVSASIGIAVYPDDAMKGGDLWRMADRAMYRAKQAGGNRHQLFSALMERASAS